MPGEKNSESYATPKPAKIARLSQTESFAGSLTPGSTGTPTGTRNTSSGSFEVPPTPCLKRLGFGTGVNVMLYERSPRGGMARSPWAIKKLRRKGEQACIATRLEEEAAILKRMSHPNIIGYRGFRREKDGGLILAVENGHKALYDIIEETREACEEEGTDLEPLDPNDILKVIRAMACALDYLHNGQKILHGDLKSGNVLIIGDFEEIKLCDFGVTVPVDEVGVAKITSQRQYVGTEPWAAIEVIEGTEVTTKTDIFALGCTIFEMLTLESPHFNKMVELGSDGGEGGGTLNFDESNDDDDAYNEALGKRPDLPDNIESFIEVDVFEKIFALFYACTSEDPKQRPSARQILDILDEAPSKASDDKTETSEETDDKVQKDDP